MNGNVRNRNQWADAVIICIGFINEKSISDAYVDLHEDQNFKFNEFMLNCSIQYTFSHEFQHILQFNSSQKCQNFLYSENLDKSAFNLKKHAWEFDADRMASYEVLKYTFSVYRNLKDKDNEKLKCMLYIALASIVITKTLFYFGVTNPINSEFTIDKQGFYIKQYSHPHPLVRIYNMVEYFYENIKDDFPKLNIDPQEILNNVLGISKIYFDNLMPNQNVMQNYFKDTMFFFCHLVIRWLITLYTIALWQEHLITKHLQFFSEALVKAAFGL